MAENNNPANKRRNITGTYKSPEKYPKPATSNPAGAQSAPESVKPAPERPAQTIDNAPTGYFDPVTAKKKQAKEPKTPSPAPTDKKKSAPETKQANTDKTPFDWKLWFSGDNMKGFIKEVCFYCGIVLASILLTFFIVGAANDVFAFIKEDKSVVVTIPEGADTKAISKELDKAGVIEHPFVFRLYCKFKKADGALKSGEYALNCNLGYDGVIKKLKKDSTALVINKFTVPVGATQDEIIQLLYTHEYATMTDLDKAFNDYTYDEFEFTKDLPARRCRLEGYLPAGEYELYEGESAVSIVSKMLQRFEETMLTDHNNVSIKATGKSIDYLVTVASLVQKECDSASEYKNVASVLANRLASPTDNYLRLTSPINYVLPKSKDVLTQTDKLTDSGYNTYLNPGIPTGPITTPSPEAFDAVINPTPTAYNYFISDDGKVTLSTTKEEHEAALNKASAGAKGTETIK